MISNSHIDTFIEYLSLIMDEIESETNRLHYVLYE